MPDGALLRLTRTGSGHPLVLCHGGPGLWDYLGPLARLLDDTFLVYRYDQRGCGLSTGEGPFTVAQFGADLEALRQEVAADRLRDEPELARRCAQLNRPVLTLHGAEDPRPVRATDSLTQALPSARRAMIRHAGHLPWLEQPQAVADEIRGFLVQHEDA